MAKFIIILLINILLFNSCNLASKKSVKKEALTSLSYTYEFNKCLNIQIKININIHAILIEGVIEEVSGNELSKPVREIDLLIKSDGNSRNVSIRNIIVQEYRTTLFRNLKPTKKLTGTVDDGNTLISLSINNIPIFSQNDYIRIENENRNAGFWIIKPKVSHPISGIVYHLF